MDHIEFPKWKYHGLTGKLVNNAQEEAELGEGWTDQPTEATNAPLVDPRDAEIEALRAALAEAQAANVKAATSTKAATSAKA